jgi:hypothetical protein
MDHEEKQEVEQVDYEQEARELEEKLRTAIRGGLAAIGKNCGDSSGGW